MIASVEKYLRDHLQGVVLWVSIILQSLENALETFAEGTDTLNDLFKILKSLPCELKELYTDTVKEMAKSHSAETVRKSRKALMWVSQASKERPVGLGELWEALDVPLELDGSFPSDSNPLRFELIPLRSWEQLQQKLYHLCGPFLEVCEAEQDLIHPEYFEREIGPFPVVQLTHYSVVEFLADADASGFLHFAQGEAESLVETLINNYTDLVIPTMPCSYAPVVFPYNAEEAVSQITAFLLYLENKHVLRFIINLSLGTPAAGRHPVPDAVLPDLPTRGRGGEPARGPGPDAGYGRTGSRRPIIAAGLPGGAPRLPGPA